MTTYRWEEDEISGPLLRKLLAADDYSSWETRAFLRPIFRWMKIGLRKDGNRENVAIERAFEFAEWLVQLATKGDESRNLPKLPALQPSYALNTIVTASQRGGSVQVAQRAFDLLKTHGYLPDVFTYTALIDILARNGDMPAAIDKYEEMRLSTSKPNIVTYTTLVRAVGMSESVDVEQCLEFLAHAQEDGAFDDALFLETLETCAKRKNRSVATQVLKQIAIHSPKLRVDDRFFYTLSQVVRLLDDDGMDPMLTEWVQNGMLSPNESERITKLQQENSSVSTSAGRIKTLGCLGHQTSKSVRDAVVQHDINRLISRLRSGSIVTVNDFETLIHQCRKRKWKEGVAVIVDAMCDLATKGWKPCHEEDDTMDDESIPPQPHLQPTSKTYVAIVDAYMCCGDEALGWQVVQELDHIPHVTRELPLYRKYVRGAYLLNNCDHIAELITLAHEDKISFTQRMGVEVARMFGYRHVEGFHLLVHELPLGDDENKAKRQVFLEELIKSCAYKQNLSGAEATLQAMLKHGYQRSAATEIALFICCLQHETATKALAMLQYFQETSLMMPVPVYDSLLREFYFKYTRRGDLFDDASRKVALKTLFARRAIFEHVFNDRATLEAENHHIDRALHGEDRDWACFKYWCSRASLSCSPLMFSQHAVQVLTTSRDKASKKAAEQSIRNALMTTSDPCLFLLQSVVALRFLDLTFRTLGKLAKQLLVVVTDELTMTERHAEYCVRQLPKLSVHIVKELDDVVALHRTHRTDLIAFCHDALETDSVDKVMGFLMRRPELYDAKTAASLAPKFAELFVYSGVSNVLLFFKSEMDESVEMRRQFVREVIELENAVADEEGDDLSAFSYTFKAIKELKLEKEEEFLPYMMQARAALPTPVYANALATPTDDVTYLKLPLAHDRIVVVDSDEMLAFATEILMRDCVSRLGLDAEWRPDSQATAPSKCSILQIACDDYVFVFDFMAMSSNDFDELFEHLFSSARIAKIGFAIDGDIKRLRWSFPDVKCFDTFVNVLDFSFDTLVATTHLADGSVIKTGENTTDFSSEKLQRCRRKRGLSATIKQALGYPLWKLLQKCDWERRPLSPQQVTYAALDAYCLLMLQDAVTTTM